MPKPGVTYKGKSLGSTAKSGSRKQGKGGGLKKLFWFLVLVLILGGAGWGIYEWSRNHDSLIQTTTQNVSDAVRRITEKGKTDTGKDVSDSGLPASLPHDQGGRSGLALKAMENAEKLYQAKRYAGAREQARLAMGKFEYGDSYWLRSMEMLNQCSDHILNGDGPSPETFVYTVMPGDSLTRIGVKFNTTAEAIQRINRIVPDRTELKVGQELTIYHGKWSIKVSNARKKLFLYDGNQIFKVYPIGVAEEFQSPQGMYKLTSKMRDPVWKYKGNSYSAGNPLNILGSRYLACEDAGEVVLKPAYLIHGTNRNENVGKTIAGPGFISMKNDDINELYAIVPDGIQVEVIR